MREEGERNCNIDSLNTLLLKHPVYTSVPISRDFEFFPGTRLLRETQIRFSIESSVSHSINVLNFNKNFTDRRLQKPFNPTSVLSTVSQ